MSEAKKIIRQLTGKVVSTKMDKTAVVAVDRFIKHKKYNKQFVATKKYKVHDEKDIAKVGNIVLFQECRPISKDKCWKLVKVLKEKE